MQHVCCTLASVFRLLAFRCAVVTSGWLHGSSLQSTGFVAAASNRHTKLDHSRRVMDDIQMHLDAWEYVQTMCGVIVRIKIAENSRYTRFVCLDNRARVNAGLC